MLTQTTRRLALVLNENAGAVLAGSTTRAAILERLATCGADITEPPAGALPDRVRAAAEHADVVVVAGGDGTAACAATVLAGGQTALGILPSGTMNLLARDLGLPINDTGAAADVIREGHIRSIDIGLAGSHTFLCACMLGGPVRLGRHREQARRHGPIGQWLQFARAALLVLRRPRGLRLALTVDGRTTRLKTRSLTITLGALNDTTGRMFGRARLDDGVLCAYAVGKSGAFGLLRVLWRLANGRPRDPALTTFTGRDITVSSSRDTLHVMVDGEVMLLPTPVRFTVNPRALRVLAPKPEHAV
jgi:diacylglycerol kinase family enzyme